MKMKEIRSRDARIPSTPLNSHCHEDPTGTVSDQIRSTLRHFKIFYSLGFNTQDETIAFFNNSFICDIIQIV